MPKEPLRSTGQLLSLMGEQHGDASYTFFTSNLALLLPEDSTALELLALAGGASFISTSAISDKVKLTADCKNPLGRWKLAVDGACEAKISIQARQFQQKKCGPK